MLKQKLDSLLGIKRFDYRECLGIYISLTDVYVAQITAKSGGISVDSLIKLPVGDIQPGVLKPADLNEGFFSNTKYWLDPIKKIIESKKWNTKDVVVSLAPNFSIHRHFVMQDMPRHYWRQAVPLQARKYIQYPFERGVYDYNVYSFFGSLSKTKKLGVVFSMTSSRIVAVIEAGMRSIGLNLVAVETAPMSIYRIFNQTDKEAMAGKGAIYTNFTPHTGQFVFAIKDTPVLMREVEVQRAIGNRNRLEITNCTDFISKQLEKNPFEDTVVVSDDGDFWSPVLESEVKRHVRMWKISEIFGFKVEGFPEMASIGACLKFLNDKVADIDLYRKNRSSDEEISGTITLWKLAVMLVLIFAGWGFYTQMNSMVVSRELAKKESISQTESIDDFKGLYASQIKDKVAVMTKNAKTLAQLLKPVSYTEKLSALPDLLPPEMWLSSLSIKYPYALQTPKEKNALTMEGMASVLEGREKELALGNKFRSIMDSAPEMADICKGQARISYDFSDAPLTPNQKAFVLGTKFTLKCDKESSK